MFFYMSDTVDTQNNDLMFLVYDVARLIRVDADKRARSQGMTRAQWVILIWLDRRPGLSQKELSEILDVEPITVARLVDRLQTRGLVERRPDPHDRRIWRLHLTPEAAPVLTMIDRQREAIAADVLIGLNPEILEQTAEALRRMKGNLCARRSPTREVA
jgi:MarR family transcriptional regulator, transcriptional regulator for hemolysin